MQNNTDSFCIVIADDDPDDWLLMKDAFDEVGITNELKFVEDGVDLLALLRGEGRYADSNDSVRPGLILLDLNMPKMGGHQALKEIRADYRLRDLPVVILTTSESKDDMRNAFGGGANSYMSKPPDFEFLKEFVNTLASRWTHVVRRAPIG
jgi:two-component system response regulator